MHSLLKSLLMKLMIKEYFITNGPSPPNRNFELLRSGCPHQSRQIQEYFITNGPSPPNRNFELLRSGCPHQSRQIQLRI